MSLRTGLTTGTCAAAAAQAAVIVLAGGELPCAVELTLPSGAPVRVPILRGELSSTGAAANAAVRKDAGDDPDVTNQLEIQATVSWTETGEVTFAAGEGVGTVTKPGLQIPPGQPAINPVPRRMITAAVRAITGRGVRVELSIPGGREIAAQTFNPRLGIVGGLSILGTTGIVRPYCVTALRDALKCSLDVAAGCGVTQVVFVPGNIGARAARRHFALTEEQLIEVGNEWGFLLDQLTHYDFRALLVVGHPGKLVKLAEGQWDTHSARSQPPLESLWRLCPPVAERGSEATTVEGLFAALTPAEREALAAAVAEQVRAAIRARWPSPRSITVCLVSMAGDLWGGAGDFGLWR